MSASAIPRGIATNAGLGGSIAGVAGGIAMLLAGQDPVVAATTIGGGFTSLLTMMLGRYWQAVKVPPAVQQAAQSFVNTPAVTTGSGAGVNYTTTTQWNITPPPPDKDNSVHEATDGEPDAPTEPKLEDD